jgi:hypothetical protein
VRNSLTQGSPTYGIYYILEDITQASKVLHQAVL